MIDQHYLEASLRELRKIKTLADKALAQVSDEHMFAVLDPESNSIAVIMQHMTGNMRSRWADFLTSDGEKPDRDRDREFEMHDDAARAAIVSAWEEGWALVFKTMSALTPDDLGKTIRVRGQAHTVVEAISRQTAHSAGHVGQIVLLAKHYSSGRWQSLSIPRGQSRAFDVTRGRG